MFANFILALRLKNNSIISDAAMAATQLAILTALQPNMCPADPDK